ncbi:hypothetical protein [Exiguobacterium sp. s130]|uniref:hypothetical protein n=1 Tax=Exiguobacterium sp. s130 TaxID=2751190 RepID=UPI001BE5F4C1|nr:hypothetical protein [Exiguobacterium sp. s130]
MNKEELQQKIDNASKYESSRKDHVIECPLCDTPNRLNLDNAHIRILLNENEVLRRSVARWEKSYDEIIESQKRLIDILTGTPTKRGETE